MKLVTIFCKYCKGVSKEEAHETCQEAVDGWKQEPVIEDLIASRKVCPACLGQLILYREEMWCEDINCEHHYGGKKAIQFGYCRATRPCKTCRERIEIAMKKIWQKWMREERDTFTETQAPNWSLEYYPYVMAVNGEFNLTDYTWDVDHFTSMDYFVEVY